MQSTIKLFKGVLVKDATRQTDINPSVASILKETIQYGFVLAPEIIAKYNEPEIKNIVAITKKEMGLSAAQANSSFHKSWKKIATSSRCKLVMEQIIHYITTYGFERLGIYSKESVYIPKEELSIPGLESDIPLTVIRGYTREELMENLMAVLSSGIAMKGETVKDIVNVAIYLGIDETQIAGIKNKESRIMLYDYLGKTPADPVEFLRLVVYKATNTTLLIKNDKLIDAIKAADNFQSIKLFKKYDEVHGFKVLAGIFNRFKPIFLAFRTNSILKFEINTISKLSKKYHEPMPEDYLNQVTAKLCKGIAVDPLELRSQLKRANLFRKARLAHALKFRAEDPVSIMYKIRNGTAFSTGFTFKDPEIVKPVLDIVIDSIVNDLKHLDGKRIYIPENIVYALPSTEKQFTGNIPSGSFVEVDRDMIAGIYWENVGNHRIDLDLAMTSIDEKIGWDGLYRTGDRNILFSGDMTDASNGASEMFYIKKQTTRSYILSVNYFNQEEDVNVPFTIFVGKVHLDKLPENYMIDPNNVIIKSKTKIDRKQKIMGLIVIKEGVARFYFSETMLGNSRTMLSKSEPAMHALRYLISFYTNPISLNDIMEKAGAIIITDKTERDACDIDLSPETVTKESFLKLTRKDGI